LSYVSSLVILEISSGRSLTLSGPGLPFQGAEWGSKSTVVTTWYPGNGDEATQQVLGPQELPSRWNGEWNRTLLGKNPALFNDESGTANSIVEPADIRDVLEDLMRGGRRLRVIWSVTPDSFLNLGGKTTPSANGKLMREGRITECKFKHKRLQDIEWEAEFAWASRGAVQSKVSSTRASTVNSNAQAFYNKVAALMAANVQASLRSQVPSNFTLGQLEALASYPTALVNSLARQVQQITSDVGSVIAIAATLASQPLSIANRAVNLARNTVSECNNFYDTLSEVPCELLTTKQDLASLVRAVNGFYPQGDDALLAARAGQTFASELATEVQSLDNAGLINPRRLTDPSKIVTVYVVKAGDTAASISQQFYQTPDHAVDILKANKLTWYTTTLRPGAVLIIPVLSSTNPIQSV
jgi:hypothetical protein